MLTPYNDTKYFVHDGSFVNRTTHELIPAAEPVFILRARDKHAIETLSKYLDLVQDEGHQEAVSKVLQRFIDYAEGHQARMKEPDTKLHRYENNA